jgi:hypothetical protein
MAGDEKKIGVGEVGETDRFFPVYKNILKRYINTPFHRC